MWYLYAQHRRCDVFQERYFVTLSKRPGNIFDANFYKCFVIYVSTKVFSKLFIHIGQRFNLHNSRIGQVNFNHPSETLPIVQTLWILSLHHSVKKGVKSRTLRHFNFAQWTILTEMRLCFISEPSRPWRDGLSVLYLSMAIEWTSTCSQ